MSKGPFNVAHLFNFPICWLEVKEVKLYFCTPLNRVEWNCNSAYSSTLQQIEVDCQIHDPAVLTLTKNSHSSSTEYEAG